MFITHSLHVHFHTRSLSMHFSISCAWRHIFLLFAIIQIGDKRVLDSVLRTRSFVSPITKTVTSRASELRTLLPQILQPIKRPIQFINGTGIFRPNINYMDTVCQDSIKFVYIVFGFQVCFSSVFCFVFFFSI